MGVPLFGVPNRGSKPDMPVICMGMPIGGDIIGMPIIDMRGSNIDMFPPVIIGFICDGVPPALLPSPPT